MRRIGVTDCVVDPNHCERADYCECRLLFWLVSLQMRETLQNLTLADMSDVRILNKIRQRLFQLTEEAAPPVGDAREIVGDLPVAQS